MNMKLQGYCCDDSEVMFSNDNNDPKFNEWVRYEDAKKLQAENKELIQALNTIDALTLRRNVMVLVEIKEVAEQALKGK